MSISCSTPPEESPSLRKLAPMIAGESTNSVSETSLNCTSSRLSRDTGNGVAYFQPGGNFSDATTRTARSEEHTSELQSLAYLVCRLLLEKKKKQTNNVRNARS